MVSSVHSWDFNGNAIFRVFHQTPALNVNFIILLFLFVLDGKIHEERM